MRTFSSNHSQNNPGLLSPNLLNHQASNSSSKFAVPYQYITEPELLKTALTPFLSAKIIGIDCETTGLDPYTAKLRLLQLAIPNLTVFVIDGFRIDIKSNPIINQILTSKCLKIGHNLKFDWQIISRQGIIIEPPFFDTYLAYKVLTAGLKTNSKLDTISRKLLNIHLDKTEQMSNFGDYLSPSQLQYAANDAAIVLPLYQLLKDKLAQANLTQTAHLEFNCLRDVAQMELNGIHLDLTQWQLITEQLKTQQQQLEKALCSHLPTITTPQQLSLLPDFPNSSPINWRSPSQVIKALNQIGIPVKSTNIQELIPFAQQYPIIQLLLEYRSLSTKISTFSESLPEHIHPITGRIHGTWFQIGAKSGRFSCREPNLTNIPRDAHIRRCFTPSPNHVFIKADYSQIELRLIAKVSRDQRMNRAYCRGEDLHRLTAALIFDKPIEQINSEERRLGKIVNFGFIYGMGVARFRVQTARNHGVYLSQIQASQFRQAFFKTYTGIKDYHGKIRRQWRQGTRISYTIDGRRRLWTKTRKPTLNELLNHPIQGANATILKRAIVLIGKHLLPQFQAKLIAVIHDEILIECPLEQANKAVHLLKRCMKKAATLLHPIPVQVDAQILSSWGG